MYGQIIDGLPLSAAALDTYDSNACPGHPLLYEHLQLSPQVLEKAANLYLTFDPSTLEIDAVVGYSPPYIIFNLEHLSRDANITLLGHSCLPGKQPRLEGISGPLGRVSS